MDVLNALTEKPKSRRQLASECGLSDRALRKEIKRLRDNGYPICSNSESGGYWIGREDDVRRLIAEYHSRAMKELATARALARRALDGQERWNV